MATPVILAFAAAAIFFVLLTAGVLIWRFRTDREEDLSRSTPLASRVPPAYPRFDSAAPDRESVGRPVLPASRPQLPKPTSVISQIIGNLAPDLAVLSDLAQAAGRIQNESGEAVSEEERRRRMLRAIDELAAREPDNRLLQSMRASLAGAEAISDEGEHGGAVRVFRADGELHILADGVEYPSVEAIPDPAMRGEARKLVDLLRLD